MKDNFLQVGDIVKFTDIHYVGVVGKFVVYDTEMIDIGTNIVYKVYCESIYNPNIKVSFYQSGCIKHPERMLPPDQIQPIGKARRSWIVTEYNP